ncbi:MAG: hypothetical protein EBZ18_03790, partial [Alphaproteobacteria bacterium]|nr:hypothetical protein [Alphaproteobacteria bacterium]
MALIRKTLILLLLLLGIAFAVVGTVATIAWIRLDEAGGVAGFIEKTLRDQGGGIEARVEEAELEFQMSATPLVLHAQNISLKAEDTSMTLPRSEFSFSWQNLIAGRFIPSDMQIFGLEINISHGREGWHTG